MDEYIDKTAVIKAINEHFYKKFDKIAELGEGIESDFLAGIASTRKIVLDQPAVDVVEVVRCKDCEHCENYDVTIDVGWCYLDYYYSDIEPSQVPGDGFCNYGKRREEDK